ncbi:related to ECM32-DNA dependent ATPase/DNA helicase B [Fusarium oxysporum]|uniref:Related to ECM32-DNA dependent ATPase/DNA helicase B n=1 Tax=Fusarium oxysporum TaxID=5507 RepID=A0A2H3T787_FUSOX|nr:related to ECM32-DNA dependent ATPase/DNA helicase B [Fusarium oxysporum]
MWRRGSWRGGRGGSRPPGPRNEPNETRDSNKPCFHFQRGQCKFGDRCKFSHDINSSAGQGRARDKPFRPEDLHSREDYYEWKHLLRKGTHEFDHSDAFQHADKLWKGAREILDGDSLEKHQELARELVKDDFNGPEWITYVSKNSTFADNNQLICVKNLLKVITHPSIKPLSIDPYVGTMYVLLGGTNGEQGIALLSRMCNELLKHIKASGRSPGSTIKSMVDVIIKALHELLSKVQRAQFSDGTPGLLKSLDELVNAVAEGASKTDLDGLRTRLEITKRVVSGSTGRIVTTQDPSEDSKKASKFVASSFPQAVAIPGGRHDNDFADISDVSLLPTQGEITSVQADYLPSTNFLHPHVLQDPMQRYIDSIFRLVRHDTLGPVNDVLRDVLASDNVMTTRLTDRNSQAQVYHSSSVSRIFIHERRGLEAIISFSAPAYISRKSPADQRDWWQRSPRLGEGTLLCFVTSDAENQDQRLLFLHATSKRIESDSNKSDTPKSALVSYRDAPSITVKLATHQQSDLNFLVRTFRENVAGVLVDFNGIIPETFIPILRNLQTIRRENHIAFQNWILPPPEGVHHMQPPLYARKAGFVFPLRSITKDGISNIYLDPNSKLQHINLKEIEDATGLDHGQCLGLVGALTREYALIQGPPGTGKSYLGVQLVRTLLSVKERADLGPILIICYTNHALDQFLKHLLDVGINAIIRIGGRSVAEELDGKNLRTVSRETPKTRVEAQILGEAYSKQESSLESASYALGTLVKARRGASWEGLEQHLQFKYPLIYRQLGRVDDEGFEMVSKDPLKTWMGIRPPPTTDWQTSLEDIITLAEESVHLLPPTERWLLVEHWLEELQDNQLDMLYEALDDFDNNRKAIYRTHDAVDERTLTRADVIGITTTSLAGRIELLRNLDFKVVLCEEAGELKESDVISSLKSGVEHFIQIGDHRQLRPQINNFNLSLESASGRYWQLDRSQFERRAVGEPGLAPAPFAQLNIQRRMRPEISQLIRRVYPNLEDHRSVTDLEDVVGMRKNLFWLDHNHPEDAGGDGTRVKSHSNIWETEIATALVRHLVRQGEYKTEDIALLTPYTGQLQQLRAALGKDFEICLSDRDMTQLAQEGFEDDSASNGGDRQMIEKKQLIQTIRLATVDNFQGEEAKVIIVSLVRSNAQRKVGFLRTENRINVLLSRAKNGMYLIGNSETYLNVPMWADVHKQLYLADCVGNEIELCCPRHKDTTLTCSEPADFALKSPEGGYTRFGINYFVLLTLTPKASAAPSLALTSILVVINALELAADVAMETEKWLIGAAERFVIDLTALVTIGVHASATMGVHAVHVKPLVRFDAHTLPALRLATRRALHVSRNVLGLVLIKDLVQCHAQRHATASLAMNDAPEYFPAECGDKGEERVDLLELLSYAEIDLDESPVVVLSCGHFFTGETLDGSVSLDEVYARDGEGKFNGLKDISESLSSKVPFCPDCKRPIRQFATKRYNRLINRAVMDQICKRFMITGRGQLDHLEQQLQILEDKLDSTRKAYTLKDGVGVLPKKRYEGLDKLTAVSNALVKTMNEEHQPTKVLFDAMATSRAKATGDSVSVIRQMEALRLSPLASDSQIVLGADLLVIKSLEIKLKDFITLLRNWKGTAGGDLLRGWIKEQATPSMPKLLHSCEKLIEQAKYAKLPRIIVAATLTFARVSQLLAWRSRAADKPSVQKSGEKNTEAVEDRMGTARKLLHDALEQCSQLGNSDDMKERVQAMLRLFEPRYEEVTPEELASIKSAMVSGSGGIATHSGHWYHCVNGHPFAIGECGMPMEEARCSECGAPIGGRNHQAVDGVTRAEDMERS